MGLAERDEKWMREALDEARLSAERGEVPVGAVVVCGEEILGRGRDRREELHDPSAHAEILALREAAARRGDWRLDDCDLYVTLEPCPMCAGAILLARIRSVCYALDNPKWGAVESKSRLLEPGLFNHTTVYRRSSDSCGQSSRELLQSFFQEGRDPSEL